jgi:hypothetical protein
MKLPRPYIPLNVRIKVAMRQLCTSGTGTTMDLWYVGRQGWSLQKQLDFLLAMQFGEKPELHHRPALCNRQRYADTTGIHYDPPANDPDYLVYLPADDHDVETRVRGQHGQHSDLALARKNKRIARKKTKPKYQWAKGRKIQSRGFSAS